MTTVKLSSAEKLLGGLTVLYATVPACFWQVFWAIRQWNARDTKEGVCSSA